MPRHLLIYYKISVSTIIWVYWTKIILIHPKCEIVFVAVFVDCLRFYIAPNSYRSSNKGDNDICWPFLLEIYCCCNSWKSDSYMEAIQIRSHEIMHKNDKKDCVTGVHRILNRFVVKSHNFFFWCRKRFCPRVRTLKKIILDM